MTKFPRNILRIATMGMLLGSVPAAWADMSDIQVVNLPGNQVETETVPADFLYTPPSTGWMEIGASSWSPGSLSVPNQLGTGNSFQSTGLPTIYGNYLVPIPKLKAFTAKFGVSWSSAQRSALVDDGGVMAPDSEFANILSLRAGAEYSPVRWFHGAVTPYLGLAILPSFIATGRSSFDSGSLDFGLPLEVSAGTRLRMKSLGIGWEGAELNLELEQTIGMMEGFGLGAGVRVLL